MTDEQLIAGCIANDRESQQKLFSANAGKFKTLCLRYMKDDMEAEDVLIEGFFKIFSKIKSYRGDGSFEGWMRRIIVNTAINKIRKNTLSKLKYVDEYHDDSLSFDYVPGTELEAQHLLKLIGELPVGYRTVFNMYAIDGFSHNEIAKTLGIDSGTSRSQLAKARSFLKRRLVETSSQLN